MGGLTVVDVADEEAARMWAGKIAEACGWPQEVRRSGRARSPAMSERGVGVPRCEVLHPAPESENLGGYCNHGPNVMTCPVGAAPRGAWVGVAAPVMRPVTCGGDG